jgi:branched-chain amino acid aminotransferase
VTTPTQRGPDPRFAAGVALIDGELMPIAEARIPITDTGFSRSDVTYDVVGVWGGAFFRLGDHVARFQQNCAKLHLELPFDGEEIARVLTEMVRVSGLREAYVDMICTRGTSREGSRDPRTFHNRFYAYAIPYVWILRPDDAMDAVLTRTVRRIPETSVDPTVKNFHWGDLVKGQYEAYDRGARYAVLLDHDGNVTEGAGYNVFALVGGRLLTPARGTLRGITQRTVLELAAEEGIPTEVTDISAEVFLGAAELFATSTAGGVMPMTSIDGVPVGDGRVGPVTSMLRERYWKAHEDPRYATVVDYDG